MMNKKIQSYLPLFSLVFSLLLLFMAFLNALSVDGEPIMNGIKAIFGGNIASVGDFASADVTFSLLNFIAFFLPAVLSIAIAIYGVKNQKPNAIKLILGLLVAISFVLSVVLISTLPTNTKALISIFGGETSFTYEGAALGIGAVLGLIFAILGSVTSILYSVLQLQK